MKNTVEEFDNVLSQLNLIEMDLMILLGYCSDNWEESKVAPIWAFLSNILEKYKKAYNNMDYAIIELRKNLIIK